MALLVFCVLFLAFITGHSSALYCLCKDGLSDDDLQKVLDDACGNGADCDVIQPPDGACYQPATVKDHCNYAVNSYYHNGGTCDFDGAATTSPNPPDTLTGCVYPSTSDSGAGTTPPSISTTPGTSPSTPKPPSTGTTPCTATGTTSGSPDVFGTSPPAKNGSSGIIYSGAVVALLLVLAPVWLALRA